MRGGYSGLIQPTCRCFIFFTAAQSLDWTTLLVDTLYSQSCDVLCVQCHDMTSTEYDKELVGHLSAYSDVPNVFVGLESGAVGAYAVTQALARNYTSASPTCLYVVACPSDVGFPTTEPACIPIVEVWTDIVHPPAGYTSCWSRLSAGPLRQAFDVNAVQLAESITAQMASDTAWPGPLPEDVKQLPARTQAVVVGAGLTGLTIARRLKDAGLQVCMLERSAGVGGVWLHQANSECFSGCVMV